MRFTPTFTPSSVFFRELDGRDRSIAPERIWAITLPQHPSTRLRTPPTPDLLPGFPTSTAHRQMLALGNQTLMNRTGEHRDAVLAHLVAEVLAGDADGAGAGWFQDTPLEVVPLFWRSLRATGRREGIRRKQVRQYYSRLSERSRQRRSAEIKLPSNGRHPLVLIQ